MIQLYIAFHGLDLIGAARSLDRIRQELVERLQPDETIIFTQQEGDEDTWYWKQGGVIVHRTRLLE